LSAETPLVRLSAFSLAAGYVCFGIVALILFAVPLWYAWVVTVERSREEILRADMQRMTEVFVRDGPAGLTAHIDDRVRLQIVADRILLLTDASFHRLAGNMSVWPANVPQAPGAYTLQVNINGKRTPVALVRTSLPGGYNLLVGRDMAFFAPLTVYFWYGLGAAFAVLVVVGVLGGVLIRRALLSRVENIRTTVQAIVRGDLGHRLPTGTRSGDEFDTLARTINAMLDHIEQLVNGIANVSNAIAHDLRTPLAELRSRLEELAVGHPSQEEVASELDAAVDDVDRVIGIFNALLRLAELDTGMRRSGFVDVNATELASEAVEFYLPAAELKDVELSFHSGGPIRVSGDRVLLAQALGNLIDNALKYAGDAARVAVEIGVRGGQVEISVADSGPGISDEEKLKVTERFYRGDASRGSPGVGLGLSLVEAVAKLHGGSLVLRDNHPGLCAVMVIEQNPLPGRAKPSEAAGRPAPAAAAAEVPATAAALSSPAG
jgi:signal transduction histidine kinase